MSPLLGIQVRISSIIQSLYMLAGVIGGKFLERGKVAKPKANQSDPSVHYQPEVFYIINGQNIKAIMQDFYIGAEVVFNSFSFILVEADEYALRYMESHSGQFPHANINLILSKLQGPATAHIDKIKTAFKDADKNNTGSIPDEEFR